MRAALLLLVTLGACWREPAQRSQPELSFVARVHAMSDLRQRTNALGPKLEYAMQRILGLASEAERTAIRDDLNALDGEVAQLGEMALAARERGEHAELVDAIEHELERAMLGLTNLRDDLLHAKTLAEREAFEELKKKTEGTLDSDEVRMRIYRRQDPTLPPIETRLPPPITP